MWPYLCAYSLPSRRKWRICVQVTPLPAERQGNLRDVARCLQGGIDKKNIPAAEDEAAAPPAAGASSSVWAASGAELPATAAFES